MNSLYMISVSQFQFQFRKNVPQTLRWGGFFFLNGNTYEKCELHVHEYKKHLNWTCKHYAIYIRKHVTHTFHFYVLLTVFCYSTLQIWTFNRCRCNSKPDMKKVNVNGILMHRCIIVGCTIFSLLQVFVNSVYIAIYIPISLKNFKLQNFLRGTGGPSKYITYWSYRTFLGIKYLIKRKVTHEDHILQACTQIFIIRTATPLT